MAVVFGRVVAIGAVCGVAGLAGCGGGDSSSTNSHTETTASTSVPKSTGANALSKRTKPKVIPPKGPAPKTLVKKELIEGTGPAAKSGDKVTVQYVGAGYKSGTEFASSWGPGKPLTFTLGAGEVIRGWDAGLVGMRVGGRRELITPPSYAYGSSGTEIIAPGATLVYVVDLLAVK